MPTGPSEPTSHGEYLCTSGRPREGALINAGAATLISPDSDQRWCHGADDKGTGPCPICNRYQYKWDGEEYPFSTHCT